jgi:hypothetical protein
LGFSAESGVGTGWQTTAWASRKTCCPLPKVAVNAEVFDCRRDF